MQEAIDMDILNGIGGKIADNADKLGMVAGLMAGTTGGFNDILSIIDEVTQGHIHLPNLGQIGTVYKPFLVQSLIAYIAGEVVQELNLPLIGKFGGALKKAAIGYGSTSFALHVAYYSTHASEGSDPVKGMQSFMRQGVSAGAAGNYGGY
jgi:hypothetical protein